MKDYKFRGKDSAGNWRYGNLITTSYEREGQTKYGYAIQGIGDKSYCSGIIEDTIGQFTGLQDRNGRNIYEGDIIEYYGIYNYTQQSFDELPPEINELCIGKRKGVVRYGEDIEIYDMGCRITGYYIDKKIGKKEVRIPLADAGIYFETIDELKNLLDLLPEDTCDADSHELTMGMSGIKVIGNEIDNPELLNSK